MSNALKYLLSGFDSAYKQSAADYNQNQRMKETLSREEEVQQNAARIKQQQAEQQNQQQADTMNTIQKGTTTDLIQQPSNLGVSNISNKPSLAQFGNNIQTNVNPGRLQQQTVPLSQDSINQRMSSLTPANRNYMQRLLTGQEKTQKENQFNDLVKTSIPKWDSYTPEQKAQVISQVPPEYAAKFHDYLTEMKPAKPEPVYLGSEVNHKLNRIQTFRGYKNPNADPKDPSTKIIGGQKYTVTGVGSEGKAYKEVSINGATQKDFTKATKGLYNDYFGTQQRMMKELETGMTSQGTSIDDPGSLITRADLQKNLVNFNQKYVEHIKKNMPQGIKDWYKSVYKVTGKNPDKRDFWANLVDAYKNNGLSKDKQQDILDMRYGAELYKATYGTDPQKDFPANFETNQDSNIETDDQSSGEDPNAN